LVKESVVADILIMGMMRLPSSDYLELSYLVPTTLVSSRNGGNESAKIALVMKCANYLERSQFAEFWLELNANSDSKTIFDSVHSFESNIRSYILGNISETFQNISRSVLLKLLGFDVDGSNTILEQFLSSSNNSDVEYTIKTDRIEFIVKDKNVEKISKKNELSLKTEDLFVLVSTIRNSSV